MQLSIFDFELPKIDKSERANKTLRRTQRLITKKYLNRLLCTNGKALLNKVFTTSFVTSKEGLAMTIDEYNRTYTFTFEQSKKIIKYLQLDQYELLD